MDISSEPQFDPSTAKAINRLRKVLKTLPEQKTDPEALVELTQIVKETQHLRQAANNQLL
jgi:outer membrane protein assembly factor BamD (BamD/ComL family)